MVSPAGFASSDRVLGDLESVRCISSVDGLAISELGIAPEIVKVLKSKGIEKLFPIQKAVLEPAMQGRDMIGRARLELERRLLLGFQSLTKSSNSTLNKDVGGILSVWFWHRQGSLLARLRRSLGNLLQTWILYVFMEVHRLDSK